MIQNDRICIAPGQYPRRTSGTFIAKRRKLSWFDHICRHDTLSKIILRETVEGRRRAGRLQNCLNHGETIDIKEWTGQSLLSLFCVADDRSRWVTMTTEVSVGVPERRLGVTGVSYLVI